MSKEIMTDIQPNEIITGEFRPAAAIVPLTTKDLQVRITEETEQRKLITEFITQHMKEGVDYGRIKVKTRDGREVETKPSLFKPGSEKFCSLFHFRPVFERDNDTWEMSGKVSGLFTYKCELVAANGAIVGEGRGAANLSEKQGWTVNNAIKIAEKRAQIDAVLRTGGLSDFFTQDLEDMPKEALTGENGYTPAPENRPTQQPQRPQTEARPAQQPYQKMSSEAQRKLIHIVKKQIGMTDDQLKAKFNFEHTADLTSAQASAIIEELKRMQGSK